MLTHQVEFIPFEIPTGVTLKAPPGRREDGFQLREQMKLGYIDHETLVALCDDFKLRVLALAKQQAES